MAQSKQHSMKLSRKLNADGERFDVVVELGESLRELIATYAVLEGKDPYPQAIEVAGNKLKRCLIKKVLLKTSVMRNEYELFFTKELIETGRIAISVETNDLYDRMKTAYQNVGDVIKWMEDYRQERNETITIDVESKRG